MITARSVDELTSTVLWDDQVKGFSVRRRASGAKYYFLKTRLDGRQRWITIGRHGSPWTPETARREAVRLLGEREKGEDPAAERDARKGRTTVATLAARFMKEHTDLGKEQGMAEDYRYEVDRFINPKFGRLRVNDLVRADVSRFYDECRHIPDQAERNLTALSKMMDLAEAWGMRPHGSNPCRHLLEVSGERHKR